MDPADQAQPLQGREVPTHRLCGHLQIIGEEGHLDPAR